MTTLDATIEDIEDHAKHVAQIDITGWAAHDALMRLVGYWRENRFAKDFDAQFMLDDLDPVIDTLVSIRKSIIRQNLENVK